MKFVVVRFDDLVDISSLIQGTAVTVSDGTNTANGFVNIAGSGENPPSLEGVFKITPVTIP